MARSGAIIADLFRELKPMVRPGVSTGELDRFAEDFIRSHSGAVPAFKGLYGFPGSVCASVNAQVVHGIPSRGTRLRDGDIVSIDVGVRRRGWCADSAFTFPVGEISATAARLLEVTRMALDMAVSAARAGGHVGDIGAVVERCVRDTRLSIVRDLVGHGVGRSIHEDPQVANVGRRGSGEPLRAGMALAIEPMLSAGTDAIVTLPDRWTVVTADGSLSAHFEHTVAIAAAGPEILTGGGIWDEPVAVEGVARRGAAELAEAVGTTATVPQ